MDNQDNEKVVLCASSKYEQKFYMNEAFENLPTDIKKELKIMSVLYTEDIGGVLTMEFDEDGKLHIITSADEGDLFYDEIGSVLKMKQLKKEHASVLKAMELYYKVFFLGISPDEIDDEEYED